MNLVEAVMRTAAARPDAVAIEDAGGGSLTYGELARQVGLVAGGLSRLGVGRGDRVALYAENRSEYLVAFLAVARLGAIAALVNATFREGELGYILRNAQPKVALVEPALRGYLDRAAAEAGELPVVIEFDRADGEDTYAALLHGAAIEHDEPVEDHDPVLVSYTSGTTARPKPVQHAHGQQVFATRAHAEVWRVTADDVVLATLPMAWMYGLVPVSLCALVAGARLVVLPHFNPVQALREIERGVTFFPGVTAMFGKLLEVAGDRDVQTRLRLCILGGEPRNEAMLSEFERRFGCAVHDCYAASEALCVLTYDPVVDPRPRPGSVGQLMPGAEARLVDAEGRPVPDGQVGEMLVRSGCQMLGYYREPELTGEAVVDGWFRTRDLFTRTPDGYYSVVGRASELIIRGGANISPKEVESVLEQHPGVRECGVTGAPSETYGEEVVAFVVTGDPDVSVEELLEHCRRHLAAYKVPSDLRICDELPRGKTGKLSRSELAEWATAPAVQPSA